MQNFTTKLPRAPTELRYKLMTGLLSVLFVLPICANELTPQELRGKQIYKQGETASGTPITALVARGSAAISASFLPCTGCHGEDGKGRPEGGVSPSDIRWKTLTAPYGHTHDYGRSHPAFDGESLAHAVRTGIDPAGNALDMAMPRYTMSDTDMADLIAYIYRIENDLDPGLSDDVIRLGTMLPLEGPLQSVGQSMKRVLDGYFATINAIGGIYGRNIELVVGEYAADPMQGGWNARDFLLKEEVFAMVGSYVSGIEADISVLAEEKKIPLVGPFTLAPDDGGGSYRYGFYMLGGLSQQAQVLARYVVTDLAQQQTQLAIIHPQGTVYDSAAKSVQAQRTGKGWGPVRVSSYQDPYFDAVDAARTLQQKNISTVLFLGPTDDLRRLADESGRLGWQLDLLLPGVFASNGMFDLPTGFEGRVYVGYSSMPADHTPGGVREFEKLHEDYGIDYQHSTAQISAFVAAEILVEGLKRAGRDLTRERLVDELEGLSDFQTGLMPPISYNATRRIGALGGYVVALDLKQKKFANASKWIELQQ